MGLKKKRDAVINEATAYVEKWRTEPASAGLAAAVEALQAGDEVGIARLQQIAVQVGKLLKTANELSSIETPGTKGIGTPGLFVGNVGAISLDGKVLVPFGLTGCGTVFQCALSKREARQLALKLLQATTE